MQQPPGHNLNVVEKNGEVYFDADRQGSNPMENVLEGRLTNLANVCRQKFNTKDTLTLDKMIDLIQNSGGEEVVKTITKHNEYICYVCGAIMDRDENAVANLLALLNQEI